jgi:signal transduction histidine kinase
VKTARFFPTTTFKLAIWYVGLFSLSVIVIFGFIYWSTATYMATQTDTAIEAEIQALAERYEKGGIRALRQLIVERVQRQHPTGTTIFLLTDPAYQPIVGNISGWPKGSENDGWIDFTLEDAGTAGNELHMARARPFLLQRGFHLLVGRDTETLRVAKTRIIQSLSWGLVFTLVLGIAGGVVISGRLLRRLDVINETSQHIMDGDLSQRVLLSGDNDEFDQLARNLNRMLDKIETLLDDIHRVSDNIAHDMKTPLARLRARLETLVQSGHEDLATRHDLDVALLESDQLLTMFNAVLRIARIEASPHIQPTDHVNLTILARDLIDLYEPLATEKSLTLSRPTNQGVVIAGDRDMLFQAFSNLIDNAIKYAPSESHVVLNVGSVPNPFFEISDQGPGIPQTEHERVFQRFHRLDQSRSTPGNGLGLSLVRAVTNVHNATISLADNRPGLTVRVTFPAVLTSPP